MRLLNAAFASFFQSQTRSRPSCHASQGDRDAAAERLSISNEKPPQLPPQTGYAWQAMCWLSISNEKPPQLPLPRTLRVVNVLPLSISNEKPPQLPQGASIKLTRFWAVSISNEKPPQLPLLHPIVKTDRFRCFNLKREAAPVATSCRGARWNQRCLFQSQTRSRPSCHAGMSQPTASQLQVSISNEKPPQLPLFLPQISARFTPLFQSQTRSRPSCHRCAWQDEQVRIDGFNLKREAAPVATGKATGTGHIDAIVSISNERGASNSCVESEPFGSIATGASKS